MNTSRDAVKSRVRREVDALFETFGHPDEACGSSQPKFQRQVLTQLAGLRVVQQQQGQLLGDLVTRFARRNMEAQANSEPLVAMPFDDYGTLKQFDCTLTGTRKEVFIRELAVKGGANPAACTKRMLRYVMTDHLACQFSWQGRKGKLSFCQMQLPSCITCAVQTAHEASDFTVEMAIREWLRHAPARQRNAIAKDVERVQRFSRRWWSFTIALVYVVAIIAGIGNLACGLLNNIFHRARTTSGEVVIRRAEVFSCTPSIKQFPTLNWLFLL
ncbi:hypothetical protein HPB52_021859 [Rhipicephalus sanguineus]|uniref:DUF4806 domain-containing protein n=1 Tax=Rhipicephalus sanguineus TaxID=34632 RepID=A0A9D4PFQ2_RHISA|nr:hypothetical protein HPB52_021859 [Rhipicephalus sanguineus]